MPLCSGPNRHTCVVDGDTVWVEGEKIRIADIDTAENDSTCVKGRRLAVEATGRLQELLSGGFEIVRGDPVDGRQVDRYGRTPAVLKVDGQSVAIILADEGLARPWQGRRSNWC